MASARGLTAFGVFLGVAMSLAAASSPAAGSDDVWRLDPEYTEVRFSWDNLGLSRQSAQVRDIFGRLTFNPTDPLNAKLEVVARVEGLRSGIGAFDTLLKSPDYFDAARYPRIVFTATSITQTGTKSGTLVGNLTIRDTTHPITLNVVWNYTGEHPLAPYNPVYRGRWVSGFSANGTLMRSRWGLTRAAPLVSDEIRLTIEAEFVRVD